MTFETDPNHRRRVDGQAMRERDAEVARLRSQGTPFRAIAERLGMSLGAVQKALVRARKLGDATTAGDPGVTPSAHADKLDDDTPVSRLSREQIARRYLAEIRDSDDEAMRAFAQPG